MSIENVVFLIIGPIFIFLSIKNFIFFFEGGGVNYDLNAPIGPQSWKMKSKGTSGEKILLLEQASVLLIFGIALCYISISSLLTK